MVWAGFTGNQLTALYSRSNSPVNARSHHWFEVGSLKKRGELQTTSLNLHSPGIYIGTRYGKFSRQEERLHYAVFFQLLMKSSPGDAEPSGSFALVAACRFEGLQDGYLFHFLQG